MEKEILLYENIFKKKYFYNNTLKENRRSANINFEIEIKPNKKKVYKKYNSCANIPTKTKKEYIWKQKIDKFFIKNKNNVKYKNLYEKLKINNNYNEILELYFYYRRRLIIIDTSIIPLLDIFSVFLFSNSYHILLSNKLKLNSKINIYRIVGLFFSILSIIIIIIRRKIYKNVSIIKYILNIKLSYPYCKIKIKKLIIEILLHLIQPYPFLTYRTIFYRDEEKDFTTIYTIDLILVSLSFFRLYTLFRILLYKINYRNTRIWNFYGNTNLYKKKYKRYILDSPILFYSFVLIIFIFFSSYVFSLFQNIQEEEYREKYYNNLWIVAQSVINCGYGDKKIRTIPSKISLIFIISLGLFLLTSLVNSLLRLFEFPSENELKAFQKIKIIYSKNEKSNSYNIYFEKYLKYKIIRIKQNLKTHKSNLLLDDDNKITISLDLKSPISYLNNYKLFSDLDLKNQLKTLKDKYYLSILAKLKFEPTINDFFNYIIKRFDIQIDKYNDKAKTNINSIVLLNNFLCEGITEYYHNVIEVFYDSNKLTNLMLLIFWLGFKYPISNYDELIKFKVIQFKDFKIKYKEFKIIYEERQIQKPINSKITKSYKDTEVMKDMEYYNDDDFDYDDYDFDDIDISEQVSHKDNKNREKSSNGA